MTVSKRLPPVLALLCATGALAACGSSDSGSDSGGGGGGGAQLDITAGEPAPEKFTFSPGSLTASSGSVTIAMDNPSGNKIPHSVALEGDGVDETGDTVGPGEVSEVTADLKPGKYTFYCTVADHRDEGMEGTLTVE